MNHHAHVVQQLNQQHKDLDLLHLPHLTINFLLLLITNRHNISLLYIYTSHKPNLQSNHLHHLRTLPPRFLPLTLQTPSNH